MTTREQVVTLKKNRLDLEHATIMQERGILLGMVVGYPFTALNIIVALKWHLEPWFPLMLAGLVVSWAPFYMWYNDRSMKVQAKQTEIEALIRELEGGSEPPAS